MSDDGIITGCDRELEWMLPWWFLHLREHHPELPVTIVDFGMSPRLKSWCAQNARIIPLSLPDSFFTKRRWMPERFKPIEKQLKTIDSPLQRKRRAWFKKPFAMLCSPFKRSLWLDVDCEVRGSLTTLLQQAENPAGIALALEPEYKAQEKIEDHLLLPGNKLYNSGVIVYLAEATLLQNWAEATLNSDEHFHGDQDILSKIINERHAPVTVLPNEFNWRVIYWGINHQATILHWAGKSKTEIWMKLNKEDHGLKEWQNGY
ncbi:MAG: glycosyltransferase [Parachlamydiaceae bacterium]